MCFVLHMNEVDPYLYKYDKYNRFKYYYLRDLQRTGFYPDHSFIILYSISLLYDTWLCVWSITVCINVITVQNSQVMPELKERQMRVSVRQVTFPFFNPPSEREINQWRHAHTVQHLKHRSKHEVSRRWTCDVWHCWELKWKWLKTQEKHTDGQRHQGDLIPNNNFWLFLFFVNTITIIVFSFLVAISRNPPRTDSYCKWPVFVIKASSVDIGQRGEWLLHPLVGGSPWAGKRWR